MMEKWSILSPQKSVIIIPEFKMDKIFFLYFLLCMLAFPFSLEENFLGLFGDIDLDPL